MAVIKIREIQCKSALSPCGFEKNSFCLNPYIGCGHNCQYCYARYMRYFTGHIEKWGYFIDVRKNIMEILRKQLQSSKYQNIKIFIGTVTDPYQPIERNYGLMRGILEALAECDNKIEILTKSNLILRDIDLLKKIKNIQINITINTLNESWQRLVEPLAPSIEKRLEAVKELRSEGILVCAMVGPYWPYFTNANLLFKKFKELDINKVTTESLNISGNNWIGVEIILKKYYPSILPKMRNLFFNQQNFNKFYNQAGFRLKMLAKKYQIPVAIYF